VIIRALTRKNRFIKQYLEAEMYLSFSTGLDKYYGLLDLAVGMGAVVQNGATYALPDGTKLGYYKSWRKDSDVWDQILPKLQQEITKNWSYSEGESSGDIDDEIDELDEMGENDE
jgi:hypothetical protein